MDDGMRRPSEMTDREPVTELDDRFSDQGASATEWAQGRRGLEEAELYWLTTVRPDGRPHVTPLIAVWLDGALYFATGPEERKAKNLARNPHVVITTGCNALNEGLDLVVEGDAVQVREDARLRAVADTYGSKYDGLWRSPPFWQAFGQPGDAPNEDPALVFEVRPTTVFGFGKTGSSQTRWRF
jgi:nitroimidazol reductase NimA-like FMN-containing flavoprotein (pyridoxamine 5'-phosphate oxidase superfamily)